MEEPSVLDYLKSLLHIPGSPKVVFPAETPVEGEEDNGTELFQANGDGSWQEPGSVQTLPSGEFQVGEAAEPVLQAPEPPRPWPWRAVIALFFALIAQLSFEPPDRGLVAGLIFYGLAALMMLWSMLVNELRIAPLPIDETRPVSLQVNKAALVISGLLMVLGFLLFTNNTFNLFNVTVWVVSLVFMLYAVWVPHTGRIRRLTLRQRLAAWWKRPTFHLVITPWTLALVAVFVLAVFYRFWV